MGLVETLIETMKQRHASLSLESLQVGKAGRRKVIVKHGYWKMRKKWEGVGGASGGVM